MRIPYARRRRVVPASIVSSAGVRVRGTVIGTSGAGFRLRAASCEYTSRTLAAAGVDSPASASGRDTIRPDFSVRRIPGDANRTAPPGPLDSGRYNDSVMRRIVDGHNDVLTRLRDDAADDGALLREGTATVTVPAAAAGGLAAGLFAVLPRVPPLEAERSPGGHEVPLSPTVPWADAARDVAELAARLFRALRACDPHLRFVRDVADLDACLEGDQLGVVLHMEGADAIDPDLEALELWHAAGLRSLGPVWSRPNAFGPASRSASRPRRTPARG